ncbi:hypothetical protein COTS27_00219 [Spirochaetota bacterium]|nr:hypothetical protein COTS27_00219 [Spirochaetota bacterium]
MTKVDLVIKKLLLWMMGCGVVVGLTTCSVAAYKGLDRADVIIFVGDENYALMPIRGQKNTYQVTNPIMLVDETDIVFDVRLNEGTEALYTVISDIGLKFGEDKRTNVLTIPPVTDEEMTVKIDIIDPAVFGVGLLDPGAGPIDTYTVHLKAKISPRLQALFINYYDNEMTSQLAFRSIKLPLDFDEETFSYTIAMPSGKQGGLLRASAIPINETFRTEVPDVNVPIGGASAVLMADAIWYSPAGEVISNRYEVKIDFIDPITILRADRYAYIDLMRTGVLEYEASVVRSSEVADLIVNISALNIPGITFSSVRYNLVRVVAAGTSYQVNSDGTLAKKIGENAKVTLPGQSGRLTLPASDSAPLEIVMHVTIDPDTAVSTAGEFTVDVDYDDDVTNDRDDDLVYKITLRSTWLPVLENLVVGYDDGGRQIDTNGRITSYGRASTVLIGQVGVGLDSYFPHVYEVDKNSYQVTAYRNASDGGIVYIDTDIIKEGSAVSVTGMYNGTESIMREDIITQAGGIDGRYEILIGPYDFGAERKTSKIPSDLTSLTIAITITNSLGTNTYTVAIVFEETLQPALQSMLMTYRDTTRAEVSTNITTMHSQPLGNTALGLPLFEVVSSGMGTLVLTGNVIDNRLGEPVSDETVSIIGAFKNKPFDLSSDDAAEPDYKRVEASGEVVIPVINEDLVRGSLNLFIIVGEVSTLSDVTLDNNNRELRVPNIVVYQTTIVLNSRIKPRFNALTLDYQAAGTFQFVEFSPIRVITDVKVAFPGDEANKIYTNRNASGVLTPRLLNKVGAEIKINAAFLSEFEIYHAYANGTAITLEQAIGGYAIKVDRGVETVIIELGLRELHDISNSVLYTIRLELERIPALAIEDVAVQVRFEANEVERGAEEIVAESIDGRLIAAFNGEARDGHLFVNPNSEFPYYIITTAPSRENPFQDFVNRIGNPNDPTVIASHRIEERITFLSRNPVMTLYCVLATAHLDVARRDLANIDMAIYELKVGFFAPVQPVLDNIRLMYYGRDLFAISDLGRFHSDMQNYRVSHIDYGTGANNNAYSITPGTVVHPKNQEIASLPISVGVSVTVNIQNINALTREITIALGDDNTNDNHIYISNVYVIRLNLIARPSFKILRGRVADTNITVNGRLLVNPRFDKVVSSAYREEWVYTNSGFSFTGYSVLALMPSGLRDIAVIEPDDESVFISSVQDQPSTERVSITVTEIIDTNNYPGLATTSIPENPYKVIYIIENNLKVKRPPNLTAGNLSVTLNEAAPVVRFDAARQVFNIENLVNRADNGELALTFNLPSGYEFLVPLAGEYSIDTRDRLVASVLLAEPAGTDTIAERVLATFRVLQLGDNILAPTEYHYSVKGGYAGIITPDVMKTNFEVILAGSTPQVENTGVSNNFMITGLTNRATQMLGITFSEIPAGFSIAENGLQTLNISTPAGTASAPLSEIAVFTLAWDIYPSDTFVVRLEGAYAAQPKYTGAPPSVTLVGLTPGGQLYPGSPNIQILPPPSGMTTYTITNITNRSENDVGNGLLSVAGLSDPLFVYDTGTRSPFNLTFTNPPGTAVLQATLVSFEVREQKYPANTVVYDIIGEFAAEPLISAPTLQFTLGGVSYRYSAPSSSSADESVMLYEQFIEVGVPGTAFSELDVSSDITIPFTLTGYDTTIFELLQGGNIVNTLSSYSVTAMSCIQTVNFVEFTLREKNHVTNAQNFLATMTINPLPIPSGGARVC